MAKSKKKKKGADLAGRKKRISRLLSAHPEYSNTKISNIVGCSADTVRQMRDKRDRPDMCNCIYFIQSVIDGKRKGPIKIGWSSYVAYRLRKIQRQVPFKMEALAIFQGSSKEEKKIHKKWKHLRNEDGEWFQPNEDLLNYIDELVKNKNGHHLSKKYPKLFITESGV